MDFGRRTEQAEEVLRAVDIDRPVAFDVAVEVEEVAELGTLVAVEEDLFEGDVEVLHQPVSNCLQDVAVQAAGPLGEVVVVPVLEDLADGLWGWEVDDGVVLGHALPVVDEEGFQVVCEDEVDGGDGVEILFLLALLVSIVVMGLVRCTRCRGSG